MAFKRYTLPAFLSAGLLAFGTLTSVQAQAPHSCGSTLEQAAQAYPGFWEGYENFVESYKAYQELYQGQFETAENGKRIIPVVVHVIHEGGPENISKNQIISQINSANLDFSFTNPDKITIPPYFDSLAADANIEFRLATKAPNGECTDGINRIYSYKTELARDYTGFKQLSYWDRAKYLNVWVVNTIDNDGNPFGSVLGYAQFPYSFGGQNPVTSTDGITLIHNRTGTMGTANGLQGRTWTHEVGHWLGLIHIWGDATCGDDQVEDTPVHREPNFGCFTFPKEATCITLDPNSDADDTLRRFQIGEMFNNYMDYSNDNCMSMFSKGQKGIMDFVFSTISFRTNVIAPENQVATGTDDAAQNNPCSPAPIADFWSRKGSNNFESLKMICAGESVVFRNGTHNGTADSYAWNMPGANNTAPTDTEPVAQYDTPGFYDVSLTATNSQGADQKTRTNYVMVSSTTADNTNYIYYDAFEPGPSTSLFEEGKWVFVNEGKAGLGWEGVENTGYKSLQAVRCNNESGVRYERFFLISPSYDLREVASPQLSVRWAYADRTNNPFVEQEDKLQVLVSTNCGETWQSRPMQINGTGTPFSTLQTPDMITAGLYPNGFVPSAADEWGLLTVDLNTFTNRENVRIAFRYESGGPFGNDLYLDDFMIKNANSPTGLDEQDEAFSLKLFPNPTSDLANLSFELSEKALVNVKLLDLAGRVVYTLDAGTLAAGNRQITLPAEALQASGAYLVQLSINGRTITRKLLVD